MGKKARVETNNRRDYSNISSNSKPGKKAAAAAASKKPSSKAAEQPSRATTTTATDAPPPLLPLPSQQRLLSSFTGAFGPVLASDSFPVLLQEVKAALFARDFEAAFTAARPESLEAYAARWSPTRALGYATVLLGIGEHLAEHVHRDVVSSGAAADVGPDGEGESAAPSPNGAAHPSVTSADTVADVQNSIEGLSIASGAESLDNEEATAGEKPSKTIKMLSIGGGAAEIAAFAAYLSQQDPLISGSVTLLDSAPWDSVVSKLHDALTTTPPISKYANAAAKAANGPLLRQPACLSSAFTKQDVLTMTRQQLSDTIGGADEILLVTLLFTLNELYTTGGIGKTTKFLLNLTAVIPEGSLLLVVDSPGSYSEAAVGKESKKYPMQWLLDHTLLKSEKDAVEGCRWEKLESHDSVWFRLADSLKYPISLENMRYQMHLYRATKP
ncbi:25S rRNA (uridine(2843)-N(3))-methyltransferase [Colletotrichum chlorophyti]|uniref:25S rRNA (Uridine(2843)-N(3))-methyltransferase n=1 Tax=Colletotrichum chlorophyti TaxID=708187 RepID=A0A1Q8RQ65_9PEZI|nr:25S rRNA (uridine(2843)-N(3))-methyltransferase [Colletotrichum chlorophyti]